MDERLVITEAGFLTEFLNQHSQRIDRPFCFILGAGVSRSSGIPTGGEMAHVWLRELYEAENFDGLALESWATPDRLRIPGFSTTGLPTFYPQLYRRRYGDHEQAGYAFLESQMEGKEPSYGYSVLAYLLSETLHKVVITTNFDNLVADSLSIHSSRFPLVIGHDALAQYAAVELRRPLVAKIHGALGFSPKSQPDEISALPDGWRIPLGRILDRYTPIVIGYEGNDGSLMGFLRSLPAHTPDRVFWCVYAPDVKPKDCLALVSPEVREFVEQRRGRFIPIRGFDELMAKLLSKLRERGSVPDLYQRLQERARQRERSYDEQQRKLFEAAIATSTRVEGKDNAPQPKTGDPALSEAVSDIAESRKEKPWWVWYQEASAAEHPELTRDILLRSLDALPNSGDLMRTYAHFLEQHDDLDEAEKYYRMALKADADNPVTLAFFADFLDRFRKSPDESEKYFKLALDADPNDTYTLARYGRFLQQVRQDMDAAETSYTRALQIDPTDAYAVDVYAEFLRNVRNDVKKAEEVERQGRAQEETEEGVEDDMSDA